MSSGKLVMALAVVGFVSALGSGADANIVIDTVTVDNPGNAGACTSLAVVDGKPAISYFHFSGGANDKDLKFTINSAADGSGTWTIHVVDTSTYVGQWTSLCVVSNVHVKKPVYCLKYVVVNSTKSQLQFVNVKKRRQ